MGIGLEMFENIGSVWVGILVSSALAVQVSQEAGIVPRHNAVPSGHPFSRLMRHAGKRWAYSTPGPQGEGDLLNKIN